VASRDLQALALLTDLRSRGFLVIADGINLSVTPAKALTLEDLRRIGELKPELAAVAADGAAGELMLPIESVAGWFGQLSPRRKTVFGFLARQHAMRRGVSVETAQLAAHGAMQRADRD